MSETKGTTRTPAPSEQLAAIQEADPGRAALGTREEKISLNYWRTWEFQKINSCKPTLGSRRKRRLCCIATRTYSVIAHQDVQIKWS